MGILTGKRALIVGVATDRSIAWGIAQAMHAHGAELAFTYGNEKLKERVEPLAESLGSKIVLPLDVTVDAQIDAVFAQLRQDWGTPGHPGARGGLRARARRWPGISSPAPRARPSPSRMTYRATASPP